MDKSGKISRRRFLQGLGALVFLAGLQTVFPPPLLGANRKVWTRRASLAKSRYELTIGYSPIVIDGQEGGSLPASTEPFQALWPHV